MSEQQEENELTWCYNSRCVYVPFYLWAESRLFTYYLVSSYSDADHRYDAETKPVGFFFFLTTYCHLKKRLLSALSACFLSLKVTGSVTSGICIIALFKSLLLSMWWHIYLPKMCLTFATNKEISSSLINISGDLSFFGLIWFNHLRCLWSSVVTTQTCRCCLTSR